MSHVPFIDPRLSAVGVSKLREFNADFLRGLGEQLYLIQDRDEPISVIISYAQYMSIQHELQAGRFKK